ncbi:MAG: 50S ribosomal protein L25 [Candidatus Latescibacterota bacterium]|nr:50S ribosomal protein L25 [Candidatus Latescibacterota bacterium]
MAVGLKIHKRETIELEIEPREERGKGPVGRLRREQGKVPGVVYGHKQEPVSFKGEARSIERVLAAGGQNAIFVVNGESAVVKEIQYHKVRGDILHVDLLRIDSDEELRIAVPLSTTGEPVGVSVGGGAVQTSMTNIEMTCVASEMPSRVEIDISDLEIGQSIHVSDLLEAESRITTDPGVTIVSVLAPRLTVEEEEAEAAEAAGEGEEDVEGEEEPTAEGDDEGTGDGSGDSE